MLSAQRTFTIFFIIHVSNFKTGWVPIIIRLIDEETLPLNDLVAK